MSWEFETDAEFQRELDWVEDFVAGELAPLDHLIENPYDLSDPIRRRLIPPSRTRSARAACGAATSAPSSAGPATGR